MAHINQSSSSVIIIRPRDQIVNGKIFRVISDKHILKQALHDVDFFEHHPQVSIVVVVHVMEVCVRVFQFFLLNSKYQSKIYLFMRCIECNRHIYKTIYLYLPTRLWHTINAVLVRCAIWIRASDSVENWFCWMNGAALTLKFRANWKVDKLCCWCVF